MLGVRCAWQRKARDWGDGRRGDFCWGMVAANGGDFACSSRHDMMEKNSNPLNRGFFSSTND